MQTPMLPVNQAQKRRHADRLPGEEERRGQGTAVDDHDPGHDRPIQPVTPRPAGPAVANFGAGAGASNPRSATRRRRPRNPAPRFPGLGVEKARLFEHVCSRHVCSTHVDPLSVDAKPVDLRRVDFSLVESHSAVAIIQMLLGQTQDLGAAAVANVGLAALPLPYPRRILSMTIATSVMAAWSECKKPVKLPIPCCRKWISPAGICGTPNFAAQAVVGRNVPSTNVSMLSDLPRPGRNRPKSSKRLKVLKARLC